MLFFSHELVSLSSAHFYLHQQFNSVLFFLFICLPNHDFILLLNDFLLWFVLVLDVGERDGRHDFELVWVLSVYVLIPLIFYIFSVEVVVLGVANVIHVVWFPELIWVFV